MGRYVRFKRLRREIKIMDCEHINEWIDSCTYKKGDYVDVCEDRTAGHPSGEITISCKCDEKTEADYTILKEPISQAICGSDITDSSNQLNDTSLYIKYHITIKNGETIVKEFDRYELLDYYGCSNVIVLHFIQEYPSFKTFIINKDHSNYFDYAFFIERNEFVFKSSDVPEPTYVERAYDFNICVKFKDNIKNASGAWSGCLELYEIPRNLFDNSPQITNISHIFETCGIIKVPEGIFDSLTNLTNANGIFTNCYKLQSIPEGLFDNFSNVESMVYEFNNCHDLISIPVGLFDNCVNVTNIGSIFNNCASLESIPEGLFKNCTKLTDLNNAFGRCEKITSVSNILPDDCEITDIGWMFLGCKALENADLSNTITLRNANVNNLFSLATNLKTVNLSNWTVDGLVNAGNIFDTGTPDVIADNWTVLSNVGINKFVDGLPKKDVILNNWDLTNINTIEGLFSGCTTITSLSLNDFNFGNITTLKNLFNKCSSLTTIELNLPSTSNVTSLFGIFSECSALQYIDLTNFNTSNVTEFTNMFYKCASLQTLDLTKFNTSKATSMKYMFYGCSKIESLDLSSFDTSNVTNFYGMFEGCRNLKSLDLSNFVMDNANNINYMFENASNINNIKCKQAFKDWCIANQDTINLPSNMREGGLGTWEIID